MLLFVSLLLLLLAEVDGVAGMVVVVSAVVVVVLLPGKRPLIVLMAEKKTPVAESHPDTIQLFWLEFLSVIVWPKECPHVALGLKIRLMHSKWCRCLSCPNLCAHVRHGL